jgi:hypothetical protein
MISCHPWASDWLKVKTPSQATIIISANMQAKVATLNIVALHFDFN